MVWLRVQAVCFSLDVDQIGIRSVTIASQKYSLTIKFSRNERAWRKIGANPFSETGFTSQNVTTFIEQIYLFVDHNFLFFLSYARRRRLTQVNNNYIRIFVYRYRDTNSPIDFDDAQLTITICINRNGGLFSFSFSFESLWLSDGGHFA